MLNTSTTPAQPESKNRYKGVDHFSSLLPGEIFARIRERLQRVYDAADAVLTEEIEFYGLNPGHPPIENWTTLDLPAKCSRLREEIDQVKDPELRDNCLETVVNAVERFDREICRLGGAGGESPCLTLEDQSVLFERFGDLSSELGEALDAAEEREVAVA